MMPAFSRQPSGDRRRWLLVCAPPKGLSRYVAIEAQPAIVDLHFNGRTVPCLGPGCPLCPAPARRTVYLPCVGEQTAILRLLSLPWDLAVNDLLGRWHAGTLFTIERGARKSVLRAINKTEPMPVGPVTEDDVQSSLCRVWSLPDPKQYTSDDAWNHAALEVIRRRT